MTSLFARVVDVGSNCRMRQKSVGTSAAENSMDSKPAGKNIEPMKILVLSNLYPPHYVGGYELHCQTIVEALRARNHVVEVLTSDHGTNNISSEVGIARTLKINGLFGHPWRKIHQLISQEQHNNYVLREAIRRFQP